MTTQIEDLGILQCDSSRYTGHANKIINALMPRFTSITKSYVYFHLFFLLLILSEIVGFVIFFTFFFKSYLLSFNLAGLFLTIFCYFTLRVYWQTRKPEQLKFLKSTFTQACKSFIPYPPGAHEHHVALANCYAKFADALKGKEFNYYRLPTWLNTFVSYTERFSCFCHWYDVHTMREILLLESVQEYISLVKCEPTSLEVHAALANAYVMLSTLYMSGKNLEEEETYWSLYKDTIPDLEIKFRFAAERAIEEFKILKDFAPDDPWVHSQLAYSYHDLKMPKEEIQEYEILHKLCPEDKENLYKLGKLYFEQGFNGKGLFVYEQLKRWNYKRAESLIKFYGAYEPINWS